MDGEKESKEPHAVKHALIIARTTETISLNAIKIEKEK